MARRLVLVLILFLSLGFMNDLHAQQEIVTPPLPPLSGGFSQPASTQNFDGFLLDTSTFDIAPIQSYGTNSVSPVLMVPPMESLIERMHINNGVVFSTTNIPLMRSTSVMPYHFSLSSRQLQGATYHLGNGGTFSLFGEYDASGNRRSYVVNPLNRRSQNSFTGGFQYKAPGNSGFSVHVQVHRGGGFPY